jgi:hypothetical protein
MNTPANTRLDEIVNRNSRSRILDVMFAAMVAMLLTLFVAGIQQASSSPLSASPTVDAYGEPIADLDGACDVEVTC